MLQPNYLDQSAIAHGRVHPRTGLRSLRAWRQDEPDGAEPRFFVLAGSRVLLSARDRAHRALGFAWRPWYKLSMTKSGQDSTDGLGSVSAAIAALRRPTIRVVMGDLLEQQVDAILIASPGCVTMHGPHSLITQLQARLRPDGRKAMTDAWDKEPRLGDVFATPGFPDGPRAIVHVVMFAAAPPAGTDVEDLQTSFLIACRRGLPAAIELCVRQGYHSIALPLLGAGGLAVPLSLALPSMMHGLRSGLERTAGLSDVVIVCRTSTEVDSVEECDHQQAVSDTAAQIRRGTAAIAPVIGSTIGSPAVASALGSAVTLAAPGIAAWWHRKTSPDLQEENAALRARVAELEATVAAAASTAAPDRVAGLPMPVAFARALVDGDPRPVYRLQNLTKAIGIVARFTASLGLAGYEALGAPDREVNAALREILFAAPTGDGRWIKLTRLVGPILREDAGSFFSGCRDIWPRHDGGLGKAFGALSDLLVERNVNIHSNNPADDGSASAALDEILPLWEQATQALEPLFAFRLVSVEGLKDFGDEDTAQIVYYARWLHGNVSLPPLEFVRWRKHLKSNHLYLVDPKDRERLLSLQPFLDYKPCELIKSREPMSLEQVTQDKVSFTTFRFSHKMSVNGPLPGCLSQG